FNVAEPLIDSHVLEGRGDKIAIFCGDETVTYRQLHERVNRMGNLLRYLGVRMEDRVAILLPDCPECAYAFFGAIKIGAVAIPMNMNLVPEDLEYLLSDSRARVLIMHPSLLGKVMPFRSKLKHLDHIVVTGDAAQGTLSLPTLMHAASPDLECADTSKDDAAFWLYSSGTTGKYKGVIHLHHDMIVEADLYAKATIGLRESDVCFSVAKLFFAYGLGNGLYFPLRLGATTVLLPDRPVPETVFAVIDRYQPTVFFSVPTSYAALLHTAERIGRTNLGKVRLCISAGEPLPKAIFEKWRKRFGLEILDGIGSTEILHIFISNRPGHAKPGSTGQLVPGYEARIVDEHGRDVPVGETGTLLIKGDSIAAGYWNKHEATQKTFLGEWVNTHDKFRMDEDGYFWYAGRTDDMMKVSGMAVWPADVEAVLMEHPAVLECGVAGVPDADQLIKPWAWVVLKKGYEPSEQLARELQNFVKTHAEPHKYPRVIRFVHELPKTSSGKIQRYKLRKMGLAESHHHHHPKT
ncbi:MAG: benzoate-CoA ligase family protein, partial [Verrucomicrobiae bacterium]|nr:benzoate-CoA ligase family protein [Verrucomicrobiae bacterium]